MSAGFKLQVTLLKCTFAKPVSYFVSLHLKDKRGQEVDKQRTELSGPTTTPAFTRNEFELMIPDSVSISNHVVVIESYVVLSPSRDGGDDIGNARLLGAASLALSSEAQKLMTVGKAETEVILLRRSEEKNANVPVGKLKVALALNAVHAAPGKTPSSGGGQRHSAAGSPTPSSYATNKPPRISAGGSSKVHAPSGAAAPGEPAPMQYVEDMDTQPKDVLMEDLRQKQVMIERLLKDVDLRSEALRKCGKEIAMLNTTISKLQEENRHLREALNSTVQVDIEDDDLISREGALQKFHLYLGLYQAEQSKNEHLANKNSELRRNVVENNLANQERETAIAKLEEMERAHHEQATYVQKLQEQNAWIGKYRDTTQNQEKVIGKLESMLEAMMVDKKKRRSAEDNTEQQDLKDSITATLEVHRFNEELVRELEQAKLKVKEKERQVVSLTDKLAQSPKENSQRILSNAWRGHKVRQLEREKTALQNTIDRLVQTSGMSVQEGESIGSPQAKVSRSKRSSKSHRDSTGSEAGSLGAAAWQQERVQLILRAEKAETRASAVEAEMGDQARRLAREMANLKVKLLESQTGIASNEHEASAQLYEGSSSKKAPSRHANGSKRRDVKLQPLPPSR